MPSKKVICHGVEDMAERIQLRVWALSMVFEPQLGFLRYMTLGARRFCAGCMRRCVIATGVRSSRG